MPEVWVALLRAVNLGPRNRVPMAGLRALFEHEGFGAVRTYVQSGNVVFAGTRPDGAALEAAVAKAFGVDAAIVLRRGKQIRALAAAHPFGADASASYVAFPADRVGRRHAALLAELDSRDPFAIVGGDIVVRYAHSFHRAHLTPARIEKQLGLPVTLRNWRTVVRLADMCS